MHGRMRARVFGIGTQGIENVLRALAPELRHREGRINVLVSLDTVATETGLDCGRTLTGEGRGYGQGGAEGHSGQYGTQSHRQASSGSERWREIASVW